jgi:hypothetical protein
MLRARASCPPTRKRRGGRLLLRPRSLHPHGTVASFNHGAAAKASLPLSFPHPAAPPPHLSAVNCELELSKFPVARTGSPPEREIMPRSLIPTGRWARFLLVPALVFIATATDRNYQTDLWHHLARGRTTVAEGRLLNEDRFTFTVAGKPLQDVNWVWQALFYRLHVWGRLALVQAVNSLVLAVTMALLLRLAWRRSGSLAAASAVCLVVFFGTWQLLIIRPQTFSLLLFVCLYAVLDAAPRRTWLLCWPPVLMALWVNLHGGFPIGLVLLGCCTLAALIERRVRAWPWLLCLTASLAATLVNPYGWHVYEYVNVTSHAAPARHIDEWLPPGLDQLTGKVWVLSVLALLGLFALSRRRPSVQDLCVLGGFLPFACGSVRMVAWWLLVSAPILAEQFAACCSRLKTLDEQDEAPSSVSAVVCASLLAAAVLSLPWLESVNPVLARPERAHRTETDLQAASDHLTATDGPKRVFTRFAWGEYVGWSLAPRGTVFMDGRIEIFPDEVWAEYAAITRGRADWEEVLARHGVDCLLLDAGGYHHDLLPLVERSTGWRRIFRQGDVVLFVRQSPIGPAVTSLPSPEHRR